MPLNFFKYNFIFFILLQNNIIAKAQDGYGPAVFKQDFGFGNSDPATIGFPLPASKTSFTFDKAVCPAPGSYTILRRVPVSNCFDKEWIDLSHDNNVFIDYGMMMLVNNIPTENNRVVYVDTVNQTMCAGGIYRFSAALINLDLIDGWSKCPNRSPNYPTFELRLEDGAGNVIKKDTTSWLVSYAARPLMGYKFAERGFDFTMPEGISKLLLKITLMRGPYFCAEDFAIDDIQIRPLGPAAAITFTNEPATIVKSVCFQQNETVSLSGIVGGYYTNTALQWQKSINNGVTWTDIAGANSLSYSETFSMPDTFLFRLTAAEASNISNVNCRVASNTMKVEVDGLPTGYKLTTNSPVCSGQDLKFNAEGAAAYVWTGPNDFYDDISYPHIFFSSLADSGWYYVDIYSLGGCVKKDSIHAMVIGTDVHARPDTAICKGGSVQLTASNGISYAWTPAAGLSSVNIQKPRAKPQVTTTYIVQVKDNAGCSDTAHVQVRVLNATEIKAGILGTDYLCRTFDSASFKDISIGNITKWSWDFGNGQVSLSQTPSTQNYNIPGIIKNYTVRLAVADTVGCTDTAHHVINVADNCYIAVATAFTPNSDGLNDYLYPLNAYKATNLLFRVYDRWGQKVFETKDWTRKWKGTVKGIQQKTGVYVWMLDYTNAAGKKVSLKGTTTLIR